jgi:hypothetical protein
MPHDIRKEIFHIQLHAGTSEQMLACKLVLRDVVQHETLKRCEHQQSSVTEDKHFFLRISGAHSVHMIRSVFANAH